MTTGDPTMLPRIGRTFGRLTVLSVYQYADDKSGKHKYLCSCTCGGEKVVRWENLKRGHTKSCGCLQAERTDNVKIRSDIPHSHPLRNTWRAMVRRCYDPTFHSYKSYGAKGVTVCARWLDSAAAFAEDMGERPDGCTLDRIDPSGDYSPENCRWADADTQKLNSNGGPTKQYVQVTIKGQTLFVNGWCKKLGLSDSFVVMRDIRRGIRPDVAIIAAWLRQHVWKSGNRTQERYAACYAKAEAKIAGWGN